MRLNNRAVDKRLRAARENPFGTYGRREFLLPD
jgi:hypothetical protein